MADLYKFLDELRAKISIVEVVGDKVKLTRKGKEHAGLCPFHNEKTPSFTVNEAKGFYHCFGCGAHGDIVKFEMEMNNLPFMEAVGKLANKAGLSVPLPSRESSIEAHRRKSYYEIMEMAAKFFAKNLKLVGGQKALNYLYTRGFDEGAIEKFRLGYAPNNNGLKAHLLSKDVSETDMIELGLIGLSENNSGKFYDFFRDRLIIPIMDKKGQVIAFGGRILGDGQPKYLNSPDTPVFNKRNVLYNLHYARDKAYEEKNIIICEGYMDVMALDKFGFYNAVAPLGTALSEEQIIEAWRICQEPTLCFDGDDAGVRAAMRSVDKALPILKAGYSLRFIFLPDKMDPDDFLKAKGRDEFAKFLISTQPLIDLMWKKNISGYAVETPEQKALIEKNLFEDVAKIKDEQVRNYYRQAIKDRVFAEFGRSKAFFQKAKKTAPINRPKIRNDYVVSFVVAAMICYPQLIAKLEEKLLMFDIATPRLKKLFDEVIAIYPSLEKPDFEKLHKELSLKLEEKDLSSLWELSMLRQQKRDIFAIEEEVNSKILAAQLEQVEKDLRECSRIMQTAESFPEEVYKRYESLRAEKESLLKLSNF